jgi:hypothetical protein
MFFRPAQSGGLDLENKKTRPHNNPSGAAKAVSKKEILYGRAPLQTRQAEGLPLKPIDLVNPYIQRPGKVRSWFYVFPLLLYTPFPKNVKENI